MKSEEATVDNTLCVLKFPRYLGNTRGKTAYPRSLVRLFFMKGRARKSPDASQEMFYFCNVLESLISASRLFSYHIKLFFSGVENGRTIVLLMCLLVF